MQGWEAIAEHILAIYRVRRYFEIGGFYNFLDKPFHGWLFQETNGINEV